MTPASLDLEIYQGSTFTKSLQWTTQSSTPVNITGCVARMHIRKKISDSVYIVSLTTENGRIVFTDAVQGKFELRLTSEETRLLDFNTAVYDFEIVFLDGEPVYRLFSGNVKFFYEVTR